MIHGTLLDTSGNVFESPHAREGQSLPCSENSRNLALFPCEMEQDSRMRRDAQSSTILNPSQDWCSRTFHITPEELFLQMV